MTFMRPKMTEIGIISHKVQRALTGVAACVLSAFLLQACGSSSDNVEQVTGFSYVPGLNATYQPYQPEAGAAVPAAARAALRSADLPYPPFNAHDIKAIGPDAWRNRDQLINAGVGGVIFNQLWSTWQPSPDLSLRDPNTFEYDGMVWRIDPVREKQIRWYSSRGIKVTAVLFATPDWARQGNTAKAGDVHIVDKKFIAPDDPADFARFAGMLAKRYNGANGNGRIVNFIIQNEVNSLDWYNPGCGAPEHPCEVEDRIESYANVFNSAYDRILQEQSQAHVFFSFDHHFGTEFYDKKRFSSAQRFIETLDPLVSPREWRMAFHSYPSDLFNPVFSPYDYPKVTFGNLGLLAGYLRQRFPTKPHAWDIHLTENGLNAGSPSSEALQNSQMNIASRNVLGTPGINNYVYHRMRDHFQEGSFQPGLHDIESRPKEGWNTWSSNNLYRQSPARLAGGYEDLPYIRLVRSVHPDIGHWASSRLAPSGYIAEASYLLLREQIANTSLLYECHISGLNVTRITRDLHCAGEQNFGPVGYVYDYNDEAETRLPLYSINISDRDYIITTNPDEAGGQATLLGYVDANKVLSQPIPQRDLSYFDTNYDQNSPPSTSFQRSPESVINALGDCSDDTRSCNFLRFSVASGLSNTLKCQVQDQAESHANILLSYGADTFARVKDLNHNVSADGDTYTIELPIANNATWASLVLSSTSGAPTDHCNVIQSGDLLIGAAEEELDKNLLQNGGFEASLTDWELCAADSTSDFSDDAYEGLRALNVAEGNCVFQEIAIDAGLEYTFSCHAQHAGSGAASVKFGFASDSFQKLAETELSVDTPSYENFTVTDRAPNGSVYAVVTFQPGGGAGLLDACSVVVVE